VTVELDGKAPGLPTGATLNPSSARQQHSRRPDENDNITPDSNVKSEDIDFELNGANVVFSNERQSEWFNDFCDIEYRDFMEWCSQEGIDFEKTIDRIGRTSSFYLSKYHSNNIFDVLYDVCDINYMTFDLKVQDGLVVIDDDFEFDVTDNLDELTAELLDMVNDIYDNAMHNLEDTFKLYDYISNFKENQVENFKDFVKETWIANI
jgi:hypothetical protein